MYAKTRSAGSALRHVTSLDSLRRSQNLPAVLGRIESFQPYGGPSLNQRSSILPRTGRSVPSIFHLRRREPAGSAGSCARGSTRRSTFSQGLEIAARTDPGRIILTQLAPGAWPGLSLCAASRTRSDTGLVHLFFADRLKRRDIDRRHVVPMPLKRLAASTSKSSSMILTERSTLLYAPFRAPRSSERRQHPQA